MTSSFRPGLHTLVALMIGFGTASLFFVLVALDSTVIIGRNSDQHPMTQIAEQKIHMLDIATIPEDSSSNQHQRRQPHNTIKQHDTPQPHQQRDESDCACNNDNNPESSSLQTAIANATQVLEDKHHGEIKRMLEIMLDQRKSFEDRIGELTNKYNTLLHQPEPSTIPPCPSLPPQLTTEQQNVPENPTPTQTPCQCSACPTCPSPVPIQQTETTNLNSNGNENSGKIECSTATPQPTTTMAVTEEEYSSSSSTYLHWKNRFGGEPNDKRSAHCIRNPDYSETCLYEEVCDSGTALYLKDIHGDLGKYPRPIRRKQDIRFNEPGVGQVVTVKKAIVPLHIYDLVETIPAAKWNEIAAPDDGNTTYLQHAYFFIPRPSIPLGGNNLFHFAQSIAMMMDPQFHNETGMYPPIETVVIRSLGTLNAWTRGLVDMLLPNNTRLILLQPGQRVCAKTAIVMGSRPGIFLGQHDAKEFRERTYQRLGLDMHPKQHEDVAFPLRVKIFNRATSRSLVSPTATRIKELFIQEGGVETFNVTFVEEMSRMSFAKQVETVATADLVIMPHGAGLTNVIFARNHVPVIEIFPRHFVKETYRVISVNSGHAYLSLMSNRLPTTDYRARPIDEINCEYWHGIDIISEIRCHHQYLKHSKITVNETQFMETVRMAVECLPMAGYTHPYLREAHNPIAPPHYPLGKPGTEMKPN
eukprot:c13145_g1_i1.p1 GENE.c13145_g1_i1~~c13145_g1_i1.p1  ORF type:complete len:699 (+),score=149.98 c13145_g1_i1:278-2374(+)